MGRPSLAVQRREQILEAVDRCLLEHGLAGTTVARIAQAASVQPSLIAHYFGNKDAVVRAAVERTLGRFRAGFEAALASVPAARQLDALLDVLFDGSLAAPAFGRMVDVLIADAHFDATTREHVRQLYSDFEALLERAVHASHPRLSPRRRADLAYGLLCLADANNTFSCIGFDPAHHAQARRMADLLVSALLAPRAA